MGIKRKLRRKLVRYAFAALVKFPQRVSEPLIRRVLEKVWRRKTTGIRQMLASVKRFSEISNNNCQEKLLENLVFEGLIENQRIRDEGETWFASSLYNSDFPDNEMQLELQWLLFKELPEKG
jgi:hypothetical protein